MTLFKQLAVLVTISFTLLFILIVVDNIRVSGQFLKGQMLTTAQDTATVLGITISTTDSGSDAATLDALFSAVFDSGYYSAIRLVSNEGLIIYKKHRTKEVQGVPDWFMDVVPLTSITGKASVMSGWMPLGVVEVTLSPGFAYSSLYKNLLASTLWFSTMFFAVLLLLWCMLHILLEPLRAVKAQANAIQENRYTQQTKLPKTLELRKVVEAMNGLTSKVEHIFKDQEKTLKNYQSLLYTDKVTGLGNRNYMLSSLEHVVNESALFHGTIIILKILSLDELRELKSYAAADEVIKYLTDLIKLRSDTAADEKYAHMSDDEFCLLIPVDSDAAGIIIEDFFVSFKNKYSDLSNHSVPALIAGMTEVRSGISVGEILADLDLGLTQAKSDGLYAYRKNSSTNIVLPLGKMQWRAWFRNALQKDEFYLVHQDVFDNKGLVIQREFFIRAKDKNNKVITAGTFMPMAYALGYSLDIDRTVFTLLKRVADNNKDKIPLALNLSPAFLSNAEAFVEFEQLLESYKSYSSKLCIEVTHATVHQLPDMTIQVAEKVKKYGQIFGIDQFDLNSPMQVLQTIRPNYVKVNAKVLGQISVDEVSAAYHALRTLTNTLDIQLIAVGVDDNELYEHLLSLNIDAAQGDLLAETKEIL